MDLSDFLLARVAEDQHFGTHDRHLAKRWDAECDAKLRIVEVHGIDRDYYDRSLWTDRCSACHDSEGQAEQHPCETLRHLAQPYADHPDFDPAWRI